MGRGEWHCNASISTNNKTCHKIEFVTVYILREWFNAADTGAARGMAISEWNDRCREDSFLLALNDTAIRNIGLQVHFNVACASVPAGCPLTASAAARLLLS